MKTTININKNFDPMSDSPTRQLVDCKTDDPKLLPARAHRTDAGADLKSMYTCDIEPQDQILIDTGVAVKIPEGYAGFVFNRSSQGKLGISIPHSVGVIDSDYRGNIKVVLRNNNTEEAFHIEKYDRIAQLVIMPVLLVDFVDAWNDTERGEGGFGSTGK
jgi:dUTP pyrophosphatase